MKKQKLIPIAALTASFVLGLIASANAGERYDHRYPSPRLAAVGQKSEIIYRTAGQSRKALFKQFHRSRPYGELLATVAQIQGKASHIRTLARIDAEPHRIRRQAIEMDRLIARYESLVAIARERSARGLDRPLIGCTLHMDAKLIEMRNCANWIINNLPGRRRGGGGSCEVPRFGNEYYRAPNFENQYRQRPDPRNRYQIQPAESYYRGGGRQGRQNSGVQFHLGRQGGLGIRFNF